MVSRRNTQLTQISTQSILMGAFMLVVMLAFLSAGTSLMSRPARAEANPAGSEASQTPTTPTPECESEWQVVASPNSGTGYHNALFGIDVLSDDNVWAVGYYQQVGGRGWPLTMHWNGTAWSIVPAPSAGYTDELYDVSIVSPNDVWAVGATYFTSAPKQTLAMHWDGSAWTIVPSPTLGYNGAELRSVKAISSNDVWAVGGYIDTGASRTFVIHWDGVSWSRVPTPNLNEHYHVLYDVVAVAPNDVWAVGTYYETINGFSISRTLVLHWDGSEWSIVPSPNVDTEENSLSGIAAISPDDIWAVGHYCPNQCVNGQYRTLTMHWDGSQWSIVPSPSPSMDRDSLSGITARSSSDVWAIGAYFDTVLAVDRPLSLHWDGNQWNVMSMPPGGQLRAVGAVGGIDIWAAGSIYSGNLSRNLVERNACRGTMPTGTSTVTSASPTVSNTSTRTATPTPNAPACGIGSWSQRALYPIPIQGSAVVAHTGMLYSFGGHTSGYVRVANAYRYDPNSDSWSPIASLPAPRDGASAVSDGTHLYILNGYDGSARNSLYRYDPQTDSYATLSAAPNPSVMHAGVYLNGLIYRIAGCTNYIVPCPGMSSVDVYTIATNSWAPNGTIAPYPLAIGELAGVTDGTYIYTAGGAPNTRKTYRYDPTTNNWDDQIVADLSRSRNAAASALINGRWVLAGGFVEGGYTNTTEALDLRYTIGSWEALPVLPAGRAFAGAATIGSTLYAIGGQINTFNPSRDNQQYYETICPTTTPTTTPTMTPTPLLTSTPAQTTPTTVPTTNTATNTATGTAIGTSPPATPPSVTVTATPTIVVTACAITFTDVPYTDTFYQFVRCLACRGIISGYADGTFKPNNLVTRGQLAKIVSNAAGYTESPDPQIFEDVSSSNTFYQWINRLARRGYMGGYPCGGVGEPCLSGKPYFRPFANATRGQTSKIVSNAAGYTEIPTDQTFEDVPPTHTFYREIQRLASRNIMGGYPCGGAGEPCLSGKPYFRAQNNVTRGQSAKIVANTFFPNCQTP